MYPERTNTLISVIVPVYNVENYLDRCVSSILNQEEKNFEILLIDDGSTDGSGEKCDNWGTKDARIRVFHKKNGGVSSARNTGLDNSRGEWVAFIDADDEVSPQYLTIPKKLLGYDVILKSFIERTSDTDLEFRVSETEYLGAKSIERWFIRQRHNALWDKIIRRGIIGDIRFDSTVSIGEDLLFFATILPKVSHIGAYECGDYIYIRRPESAMFKSKGRSQAEHDIVISERLMNLSQVSDNHKYCRTIIAQQFLPRIRHYIQPLTLEQQSRFMSAFRQINIFNMPYLTLKDRLRYIYTLFFFKFKTGLK